MAKLAASAYGQALYELAIESGSAAGYLDEVQIVLEVFKENGELTDFLNNPKISKTDKVKTMESIFDSRVRKDITGQAERYPGNTRVLYHSRKGLP